MEFEADPVKAAQNFKKHKVSSRRGGLHILGFNGNHLSRSDHSIGEIRWLSFGMSSKGRVLAVIHTERRSKVRLISARVAATHERKVYEED